MMASADSLTVQEVLSKNTMIKGRMERWFRVYTPVIYIFVVGRVSTWIAASPPAGQ